MFFVDFLVECFGKNLFANESYIICIVCLDGEIGCTLNDVLIFFSGANCVPPLGFEEQPSLLFVHRDTAMFPTASTCDLQLRLPAQYNQYKDFREAMILGVQGNDGFGGV